MLNRGHYPYTWLWTYGGDKFLKPKAHKNFHRRKPTTYYYWRWMLGPGNFMHAPLARPLCCCGGLMRACCVAMRAGVVSWACLS